MPNDAENAGRELRTRVARYIARHRLLNGEGPLFIGFSGGADSSALLLLLHEIAPDAIAIHLHHGLRDDAADRDAAWCAEFCGARRIAFECHALRVPANRRAGESAETAARRCRLEFWQQRAGSAATVALGHQADDNLETLLQRLLRGANASGLAALRPSRVVAGVRFVRPLLCAQRPELVAFLETEGVHDWREDLTNLDTRLNRNAIRHRCLPLLRQITGHDLGLRQSLAALCDDADFIERAARNALPQADHAASLRQLHPALLPRVVRLWLRQRLGRDMVPSRAAIERLQAALDAEPVAPVEIPFGDGVTMVLARGQVRLRQTQPRLEPRTWPWRKQPCCELPETAAALTAHLTDAADARDPADTAETLELFTAKNLPDELTVRTWRAGDRLVPFGRKTPKKLQDLFTDAHIPQEHRSRFPVILAGDTIVWVPGLRRAEFARVRKDSDDPVAALRYTPTAAPPESV